jgi:hypothetical protein
MVALWFLPLPLVLLAGWLVMWLACADDYSFVTGGNLLSGFATWLMLLIVTVLAEAAAALGPRARPDEDSDDTYNRYPDVMF